LSGALHLKSEIKFVRGIIQYFGSQALAEAERWGMEIRGLSCEELTALIGGSTREIPTTEHRRLHQEASDFVRWGRRGSLRTLALYVRPYLSLLA
jgi:hypothetical protein